MTVWFLLIADVIYRNTPENARSCLRWSKFNTYMVN